MRTTNQLTTLESELINLANRMEAGRLYREGTRNPDAAVRARFSADRETEGTRAWAITRCQSLNSRNVSDDECRAIINALQA